jgi:hypothetical protein
MKSYKSVAIEGCPSSLVDDAVSEIQDLVQEITDWKSGMEGTNLENSEKYQLLDNAESELSSVENDIDEWPNDEVRITCYITMPKRVKRSPSRAVRLENANAKIGAVKDFYESLDGDYSEIIDKLDGMIKEVEFPRMYG